MFMNPAEIITLPATQIAKTDVVKKKKKRKLIKTSKQDFYFPVLNQ